MRRRDVVFACLAWAGLLGGLVWALSTQARWVQESKPIEVKRPILEATEPDSVPVQSATGVIGTVSDDTRAAMARGLAQRKAQGAERPVAKPQPQRRSSDPPGEAR